MLYLVGVMRCPTSYRSTLLITAELLDRRWAQIRFFVTITTQMFCLLWTRITRYQPGFERLGPVCFSKRQLFAEAPRASDSLIKKPPLNLSPTSDKSLLWPETGPCLEVSVAFFPFVEGRKPAARLDISGTPGVEQLRPMEREVRYS